MQGEVSPEQYAEVLDKLQKRIRDGRVEGIADVRQAKKILRKGHYSYEHAVKMCKAGGIYGLKYDVQTGLAGAALAGSLSLAIELANGDWQDGKFKDTAKSAAGQTVMNGGVALGTHVATAQLSRAGATKAMRPVADAIIKKCSSPKVTGKLASTVSGKALHGAATSSYLSKVTRGNALSIGVVSAVEAGRTAVQLANGKLKGQQAARHTVKSAAGLTAGSIG